MLKGIPVTGVPCETAQKINHEIVQGIHPEDGNIESAVIAHTLLCENCRNIFLNEAEQAKDAKLKSDASF